jgi:hypothetical protein
MTSKIHGLCLKCGKRKTCKAPCAPIEHYLKRENLTVFEKQQPDGTTILYPKEHGRPTRALYPVKGNDPTGRHLHSAQRQRTRFTGMSTNKIQTSCFHQTVFWEMGIQGHSQRPMTPQ